MYLFKDRRGRTWITAAGIYRYFGVVIRESAKKYFYDYDWILFQSRKRHKQTHGRLQTGYTKGVR